MRHKKKKPRSKEKPMDEKKAEVVKKDSVVDAVFDTLTEWTVHGLEAAQRGLEASARWLDGRAKVVEKLATKIGEKPATAQA